ncbi:MAG: NAD(P)/FAD-dependent oxidoreductase [Deltaproteobacteria bacterium]|nr:NAD(P)/FAD-dependent oxidoreductase [Deltaproteobacteria bacterium]MBW2595720.1 NAD(P)/FAD-dependent oxidoreductase [Deltaproteobacteria bacterium]
MADYDAIVIGAGNGGLTSSCALAQTGLRVLLLERHNIPGGCGTSFCRGPFEFEVALHQLSGLGRPEKPGPLRMTFDSLGVTDDLEFVEAPDLYQVAMPDGFRLPLKTEIPQMIEAMQQKFPSEKEAIKDFFDLMGQFANDMMGAFIFRDPAPSREKYPALYTYALRDVESVLNERFKDPLLKAVFAAYWGYLGVPPCRLSFAYLAMLFFQYSEFKPFHVKGGSQAMSNAIFNKFLTYGGEARFSCGAKKIIVEKGEVKAVITEEGDEITTNYVVSNASQAYTYIHMIDPEHVPENVISEVKSRNVAVSAFTMFIGYDCEPEELGITESMNFLLSDTDFSAERVINNMWNVGIRDDFMAFSCYDIADPDFSPPGKCQTNTVTLKYGEPWLNIDPHKYHDAKFRCADEMLHRMEQIYPDLRKHIEEIEVATPLTFMRYLGHSGGSIYGYEQLIKDSMFFQPKRDSPIKGLYFAGGWAGDCGFEPTLNSGKAVAKSIARQLGK